MKPIKLKELLRTAKDPATQRIVIDEGLWFDAPLFEGVVKDVDEALGERIISNWQVETDGTRLIVSSNPPLQDLQECRPSKIAHVNIETGEVLVDRVHDRTYTVDDVDDYAKFLPYARKQVRAWETKDGKMIFYILPPRKKKARR